MSYRGPLTEMVAHFDSVSARPAPGYRAMVLVKPSNAIVTGKPTTVDPYAGTDVPLVQDMSREAQAKRKMLVNLAQQQAAIRAQRRVHVANAHTDGDDE